MKRSAWTWFGAALGLALSISAQSTGLPLQRIVLYKSGVGFFEHAGNVEGNAEIELDLTRNQLDDVLKSLTAVDFNGGRISGAGYSAQNAPVELNGMPLPSGGRTTLEDMLQGMRNARLEVSAKGAVFSGQLLNVEEVTHRDKDNNPEFVTRLTVLSSGGDLRLLDVDTSTTLRFLDPAQQRAWQEAWVRLNTERKPAERSLRLSATGSGTRRLQISYISEVPIWKTTYRVVLPAAGAADKPLLQGWAIVDNTVGEDWDNVQLTLAAGAPQSFIQQLSLPYYARRSVVPLPQGYNSRPELEAGTVSAGTGVLTGRVTDTNGAALAGARVSATPLVGTSASVGTTDSQGQFLFAALDPGAYTVSAARAGFATVNNLRVEVSPGQTATLNPRLLPAASPQLTESTVANMVVGSSPSSTPASAGFGGGGGAQRLALAQNQIMSQSVDTATAASAGDVFEYTLHDPVTIPKNQSALVPILQANPAIDQVSLWNPAGGNPHPLRALWLTNSTGEELDGGTFDVTEANTFAGEGIVTAIRAGERRLMTYATDTALTLDLTNGEDPQRLAHLKIADGMVTETVEMRRHATYTAHNIGDAPRAVVVEHSLPGGWKLAADMKPEDQAAGVSRFRFAAPPQSVGTLVVEEIQSQEHNSALADLDEEAYLRQFSPDNPLPAAAVDLLHRSEAAKAKVVTLSDQRTQRASDLAQQNQTAERVRQDLETLNKNAGAGADQRALAAKLTQEMGTTETSISGLNQQIAALDTQIAQAVKDRDQTLQSLRLDLDVR